MLHSILPPSSAGIWGRPDGCTGWVLMSQMYPETGPDEDALEGEASHEIASTLITDAMNGPTLPGPDKFVDNVATNGIVFTKEMYDGAKLYADEVSNVMRDTNVFGGECLGIEQRLQMPKIHDLSYGTTDCFIYARRIGHLFIWDYKFGFEMVEAFENWQTINYIEGIVEKLNIQDENTIVHVHIAQPRAHHREGPLREWVTTLGNLRSYFNQLRIAAHEALGNDSVLRTGSHCKHCQARHACQPYLTAGMGLLEMCSKPIPVDLSPAALGVQLAIVNRGFSLFKSLKSALEVQVESIIRKGVNVPHFMAESNYGKLKWSRSVAEIIALGNIYGKNLKKPDDVMTPTQAKAAGMDVKIVDEYSSKTKTGMKIVPDDGSKARKIFS